MTQNHENYIGLYFVKGFSRYFILIQVNHDQIRKIKIKTFSQNHRFSLKVM